MWAQTKLVTWDIFDLLSERQIKIKFADFLFVWSTDDRFRGKGCEILSCLIVWNYNFK